MVSNKVFPAGTFSMAGNLRLAEKFHATHYRHRTKTIGKYFSLLEKQFFKTSCFTKGSYKKIGETYSQPTIRDRGYYRIVIPGILSLQLNILLEIKSAQRNLKHGIGCLLQTVVLRSNKYYFFCESIHRRRSIEKKCKEEFICFTLNKEEIDKS